MAAASVAGVAPVSPTSLVPPPVSRSAGRAMAPATTSEHHDDERREEGAGAAALADFAVGDEPGLAGAVHAATA